MGTDTIEQAKAAARARRESAESTRATKSAAKLRKGEGKVTSNDMVAIWNDAAKEITGDRQFYCPPMSRADQARARRKLVELLETQPDEAYSPGQFLLQFFTWVVGEWSTMKHRHGTKWMHDRDMLPRHPEMTFVVHHWKFFRRSYADKHTESGYDYVSPEVDELREENDRLKKQLQDAKRFAPDVRMDYLRRTNKQLQEKVDQLSAKVPVDLDSDLPEWEEEPND